MEFNQVTGLTSADSLFYLWASTPSLASAVTVSLTLLLTHLPSPSHLSSWTSSIFPTQSTGFGISLIQANFQWLSILRIWNSLSPFKITMCRPEWPSKLHLVLKWTPPLPLSLLILLFLSHMPTLFLTDWGYKSGEKKKTSNFLIDTYSLETGLSSLGQKELSLRGYNQGSSES